MLGFNDKHNFEAKNNDKLQKNFDLITNFIKLFKTCFINGAIIY